MRVLTFPQLSAEKGITFSRVHIHRLEKAGKFPRRIKLGERFISWDESEIDAWLRSRADARAA